jgi:hypothetical protein
MRRNEMSKPLQGATETTLIIVAGISVTPMKRVRTVIGNNPGVRPAHSGLYSVAPPALIALGGREKITPFLTEELTILASRDMRHAANISLSH